MSPRTVLLLGATGLVGRELLQLLLDDETIATVRVIGRRRTGVSSPKLDEQVFDLGEMERYAELFAVDAIFCALGTTIKAAGSEEKFRLVDRDYPLIAGQLGRRRNAQHYLLVSSTGADPASRNFYLRVKGEVERDILQLGYPRTTIARPSFLRGERNEFRLGERVVAALSWLLPPAYKTVPATSVARALVDAAHEQTAPVAILHSRAIRERRA